MESGYGKALADLRDAGVPVPAASEEEIFYNAIQSLCSTLFYAIGHTTQVEDEEAGFTKGELVHLVDALEAVVFHAKEHK